jgi:hypothetical protein
VHGYGRRTHYTLGISACDRAAEQVHDLAGSDLRVAGGQDQPQVNHVLVRRVARDERRAAIEDGAKAFAARQLSARDPANEPGMGDLARRLASSVNQSGSPVARAGFGSFRVISA